MAAEAARVKGYLSEGLDVYAFFNNDAHGWAIENVRELTDYVNA